ncbi:hypothetical protein [Allorhizocola rhizosphaerae]|uniref:hypothetical protein n=1 Tax=Allorhizocola rhizosphaerae TaxID=1872709 RepID=UPI000E3BB97C|nr:hypothetical protein [Allorhizocola rhizosphaerae]
MLRALFGRHKAASTWARNILHEAAHTLGLKILTLHVPEQWAAYDTPGDFVKAENPDLLIMTNARQKEFETLPPLRGINLIRDPRDIIVSGYFSHRNSHPEEISGVPWSELQEHRKQLLKLDKDAGLIAEIDFSRVFLDPMAEWNQNNPGVLEVRMEELTADPLSQWTKVFRHFDLLTDKSAWDMAHLAAVKWNLAARRGTPRPLARLRRVLPPTPMRRLPASYMHDVLERFSFTRLTKSGRRIGEEDVNSHYRKGVAGDWRNHLTDQHLRYFRKVHGDLVEHLGYRW